MPSSSVGRLSFFCNNTWYIYIGAFSSSFKSLVLVPGTQSVFYMAYVKITKVYLICIHISCTIVYTLDRVSFP